MSISGFKQSSSLFRNLLKERSLCSVWRRNESSLEKKETEGGDKWEPRLSVFASKKLQLWEWHRLSPMGFTKFKFQKWKERNRKDAEILSQKYISERHNILGNDLATAHFVLYRGGKVRFEGRKEWMVKGEGNEPIPGLPRKYVRGLYVEALDLSNTPIRYEGLDNLISLTRLKELSLSRCQNVDDWFLDRVSGEFSETLEHLDVSYCEGITWRGLSCLYRLPNLRVLDVTGIATTPHFQLSCLLLEDAFPSITIRGVHHIQIDQQTTA